MSYILYTNIVCKNINNNREKAHMTHDLLLATTTSMSHVKKSKIRRQAIDGDSHLCVHVHCVYNV